MTEPIRLPPKTNAKVAALANEMAKIQQQINDIIDIAKETMGIPDDWTITNLDVGFVPPPAPPETPAQ